MCKIPGNYYKMTNTKFWSRRQCLFVAAAVFISSLRVSCTTTIEEQDGSVTCDVPSVESMDSTSVTCHFPEDVSQTKRDFYVSFYKDEKSEEAVDIMACLWLLGKISCIVSPGYKFTGNISHKASLEIPQASLRHAGRYACQISNINANDIKPCEFKIKLVNKTMCFVPSVSLMAQTLLTCYFPEDFNKTKTNVAVYHNKGGDTDITTPG
ncbi:uncharacterized protein LOC112574725 [Pomacea canaliculata]|uniref:uncharacterized protein LOC112574725 n=1 Tax=Pomacea canaliculata TaxID=400727 RepID=UPI000D73435E|nr:uncharacterized protein LOC112574725 [Pomacea canaliculata]